MKFIIRGRIKPYVRMTQRGKFVKKNAQEYLAWKADAGWQFLEQLDGRAELPAKHPLGMRIHIIIMQRLHCFDLDNAIKAIGDAAQGIVFLNDLWIDEIHATRRLGDEDITHVEFWALSQERES